MICQTVQVLSLGKNLKTVKSQYKHIIVDEAQDLNPVQHAFFGLISGTMEEINMGLSHLSLLRISNKTRILRILLSVMRTKVSMVSEVLRVKSSQVVPTAMKATLR